MKTIEFIKAALFTKRCALCGEVIELDSKLCDECLTPPAITGEICKSCGCSKEDCNCKKNKNEYKQITAPFYYDGSVVRAIHNFKEGDLPFIAEYLSDEMCRSVTKNFDGITFDLITFVPLGELKMRTRGFNQSKLLAEKIGSKTDTPVKEILYKCRHTATLHKNKSKLKRSVIVFGAYDVYEDCRTMLDGKTILLVDDVKTTGSTLNECAKMLKIYGAEAVYAVSAAITKK